MTNNNIIKFSNPRAAREEIRDRACCWLARLDAGPTEKDIEELGAWLDQSPEHKEMLLEMAEMWDNFGVLSDLAPVFPLEQYQPPIKRNNPRKALVAAAASILLGVITLGSLFNFKAFHMPVASDMQQVAARVQSYETRIGEQSTVMLVDGSSMILNTNTLLEVGYSSTERVVRLKSGEVHFEVAKDETRPFRVYAGGKLIQAVGTAFAIQHLDDGIEVTVTQGEVSLQKTQEMVGNEIAELDPVQDAPVSLTAGEMAIVSVEAEILEVRRLMADEMEIRLSWRHGMLLFQENTLEEVIKEVSRYTQVVIEADEAIKDIKVGGYFKAGDIDGLLIAMRENFNVDAQYITDNSIYLVSQ